jgi:transglutaminase-like putative cysteine protease
VLYHSWKSENIGYLVFFFFYASVLVMFKDYINSGFYAIINDTLDWASVYFNTEGLQYYNERISNRYAAVTIAVTLIGIAINILLNNYILRRARYIIAIALTLSLNMIAFYMRKEPSGIYTAMVIGGIVMTFFLKSGRHFYLSRNDHIFKRSRRGLSYGLDWHSLLSMITVASIYVILVVTAVSALVDKSSFALFHPESEEKKISKEYMQNLMLLGIGGIFNFYDNTGGLASGKLGGVSSIQLDYNTDITVEFTPYTENRMYFKNFIGLEYSPYENVWKQPDDFYFAEEHGKYEADALEEAFENGYKYSNRGTVRIKNVEGDIRPYIPYYTNGDVDILNRGEEVVYTYYPRVEENKTTVDKHTIDKRYLSIPRQNEEVISNFCEEAGFGGSKSDIIQQVEDYYQDNIPYTIRPGATPWREDFVNYFLTKNRKGYCAHFASAAVLIFRYYGIPARYCEGYVVDFGQIMDEGELVEGKKYEDYFSGYNKLGETALVTVDATDADAHAWVEVYDDNYGWVVVDVTPASGIDDEDYTSFWDTFNNLFGDGGDSDQSGEKIDTPNISDFRINDNIIKIIGIIVGGIVLLTCLIFLGIKVAPFFIYHFKYSVAGKDDKLILKYSRLISRAKKRDSRMKGRINYRTQVRYMVKHYTDGTWDKDKLTDIFERAGFSNREVSDTDYKYADDFLNSLHIIRQ